MRAFESITKFLVLIKFRIYEAIYHRCFYRYVEL